MAFIGNGGLERARVFNKPRLKDAQGNDTETVIHAYKFSSNWIQMYLAIFYAKATTRWNLKSFHEPNDPEPTLGGQLHQAILQKQLGES